MKFYEFFDCEDTPAFLTKREAIKAAREHGAWLDRAEPDRNREPITVDEIDIGAPTRAKICRILNAKGYVENRRTVWTENRKGKGK